MSEVKFVEKDGLEDTDFTPVQKQISDAIEVAKDKPNMTPVQIAEHNYSVGIAAFRRSLSNFSKKDLIRVLRHVISGPLDADIKFQSGKESRLASLADQLLVCRLIIQRDDMMKSDAKKIKEQQNVTNVTETQGDSNVGSEN